MLMHVFVYRVCECVGGGADSGGVFQPKCGVAGKEVCIQVPPVDGEWGGLCVASELTSIPPSVCCMCLCMVVTDPHTDTMCSCRWAGMGVAKGSADGAWG